MTSLHGAGLALRRESLPELRHGIPASIDFLEIAPENWMNMGGRSARDREWFMAQRPVVCHGLSLSLGGTQPLDRSFLQKLRRFLDHHHVPLYSEHLSFCSDDGHLYDLLPIPFTEEAVHYIAARIRQTQDLLGRRIAVENTAFYVWAPINSLSELEFIQAVLSEADCDLHLDVNNVYVNSVNHGFDASAFITALPSARIVYQHVAGHFQERPDLLVDTHGSEVIDPVWDLLQLSLHCHGPKPTLLERDFHIPPLAELLVEVEHIKRLQEMRP